jgi:hypothetical protein
MGDTKRDQKRNEAVWNAWFKKNYRLQCYTQLRAEIALGKSSFFKFAWIHFKDLCKEYGILKKDFEKIFYSLMESKKMLPYQDMGGRLLKALQIELAHKVDEIL